MLNETQEIVYYSSTIYYSALFTVGFICGVSRTLRNGDYEGLAHCLSVGLFAGCTSCAVVAVFAGDPANFVDRTFFYWGVAAFIGLSGKEGVILIQYLLSKAMMTLGVDLDEAEKKHRKRQTPPPKG